MRDWIQDHFFHFSNMDTWRDKRFQTLAYNRIRLLSSCGSMFTGQEIIYFGIIRILVELEDRVFHFSSRNRARFGALNVD